MYDGLEDDQADLAHDAKSLPFKPSDQTPAAVADNDDAAKKEKQLRPAKGAITGWNDGHPAETLGLLSGGGSSHSSDGDHLVPGQVIEAPTIAADIRKQKKLPEHFADFPSGYIKQGCHQQHNVRNPTVCPIVYLTNSLEAVPLQTLFSVLQFSRESGISINAVIVAFKNDTQSAGAHQVTVEAAKQYIGQLVNIETVTAGTEWQAKKAAVELVQCSQV